MFNVQSKNIFILAPHTDDGELGCGGSIARFIEEGANVYYFAFSTAEKSVPKHLPSDILKTEVVNATSKLGIKNENLFIYNYEVRKLNYVRQDILEELIRIRRQIKPDIVFIPSLQDIHQDHFTVAQEGLRAFKNSSILGYELIWNNLMFKTDMFIKLEKRHIEKKIMALNEYKSQSGRNYMSEEFIYSIAKTRGVQVNSEYAEAFEVVRFFI